MLDHLGTHTAPDDACIWYPGAYCKLATYRTSSLDAHRNSTSAVQRPFDHPFTTASLTPAFYASHTPQPAMGEAARISAGIAEAASLREQGNELWRQGAVNDAMVKYHHCLNHLNGLDRYSALGATVGMFAGGGGPETPLTAEQKALWREVFVAANLNLAAGLLRVRLPASRGAERCLLGCSPGVDSVPSLSLAPPSCFQKEKWARCVEVCNTALSHEPSNVKALLRRAKACLALREVDAARRDLDAVQAQNPTDQDAAAMRRDLARLDAELAAQEATLWKQAFAKSNLGA